MSVPIFSLVFNNIGHANYDFSPKTKSVVHNASRRHHLHYPCFNGNFSFMFQFMDQLLRTALPPDAASVQLARWQERNS